MNRCYPDRAEIEREWRLFHTVLPAMVLAEQSALYPSLKSVPGMFRTPYFYRKTAIAFARDARLPEWFPGQRKVYLDLAKRYLASYRELCEKRRAA